jgi:FkbM family methyltransferase
VTAVKEIPNRLRSAYWKFRTASRDHVDDYTTVLKAAALRSLRRTIDVGGVKVRLGSYCSLPLAVSMMDGQYELPERTLVSEALEDDDVVLELGTGIGVVTVICSRRLGAGRVHSFEANPNLIPVAEETFRLNGVAPSLENTILGVCEGERTFYVEKNFWSSSTVKRSARSRPVKVTVRRLDDAIETLRPTVLIVDIEGGEAEVFDTVQLGTVRKVLIEFHPHVIGQDAVDHIKDAFRSAGFVPTKELFGGNQIFYQR